MPEGAAPSLRHRATRVRRRFQVSGVVQGVGFRPFVYVTAARLGLAGSVVNTPRGVSVEVEGEAEPVALFGRALLTDAPALAVVASVEERALPPRGGTGFSIGHSETGGTTRTLASPDVALCRDCRDEL